MRRWIFGGAALALLVGTTGAARAGDGDPEQLIEAGTDVWIRESSPETTYEDDLISVWASLSGDGGQRVGIVEFDLSRVDPRGVTGAVLRLWAGDFDLSDDLTGIRQSATVLDTSGGTPAASMTWAAFVSEHPSVTPLGALGRIDFDPASTEELEVYVESQAASPVELALLGAIAESDAPLLTLALVADSDAPYAKSWGDGPGGFGGQAPLLLLTLDPAYVFEDDFEGGHTERWTETYVGGDALR